MEEDSSVFLHQHLMEFGGVASGHLQAVHCDDLHEDVRTDMRPPNHMPLAECLGRFTSRDCRLPAAQAAEATVATTLPVQHFGVAVAQKNWLLSHNTTPLV